MKKLSSALLLTSVLSNTTIAAESPKNIIMIVGDGMGAEYTSAYRYFNDNPSTPFVETTVFDRLLVGGASTYPHLETGYVTDSAASATALATGTKSYNGAIGVDHNKEPVESVLEKAKKAGMKTGIVVTSQINHATPASYIAHNEHRQNYNEIADSYYDERIANQFKVDVMLGGGWQYFIREDRNLVAQFKSAGYQYVDDYKQLENLSSNKPTLGLFGDTGLKSALDVNDKDRLAKMVKTAIKQLENKNGYFLLIEASQIDWCGHANDIACAMGEMQELAVTLEYLESYLASKSDTLLVATADHSTGGLTLAAKGEYKWDPTNLRTISASPRTIAKEMSENDDFQAIAKRSMGFELTSEELTTLSNVKKETPKALYKTLKTLIDNRTNTGWTTSGHTAIDVQVFSTGVKSDVFNGYQDNIEIAEKLKVFIN